MRTIILSVSILAMRRCYSAKSAKAAFATKHEHAHTPLRRYILPLLVLSLFLVNASQAQIGSSISAAGSAPNDNAMLDVQSPATGDGKGILIPRVTQVQRTTASAALAGGLLDNSGNLRGGAGQGLIVYQTDGSQGLYFNTSQTAMPAWVYLGEETDPRWASVSNAIVADIASRLSSNVWASAGSTTNYLPLTGGTMSGALNMGAQVVTNVAYVDFSGNAVSVGRGANGYAAGAAVGYLADGYNNGAVVGPSANGANTGAALGYTANGANFGAALGNAANGYLYGAAVGRQANGTNSGAALGYLANGSDSGAAVGLQANGYNYGVAAGREANGSVTGLAVGASANGNNNGVAAGNAANGYLYGAALGRSANGSSSGAAVGRQANGYSEGVAVGYAANGYLYGAALGRSANGTNYGAVVGYQANGSGSGAALGLWANGYLYGVALGRSANGSGYGAAVGYLANGTQTNVAIGVRADAQGGTQRIAVGNNVTNQLDNTAAIRGHLYLDGGTGMFYRATFGTGSWTAKAFEIDHPLDPENKILRHFCLEGPQVWNVYAGNVQLVNGQAVVQLPDYYSALNLVGSEIYNLTPISQDVNANAVVKQKVSGNTFVIAGNVDMEVSWTIKVLRNDPGCREDLRRRPVEQRKSELETGN